MRKFLSALILIPLGLISIVFAVANRHLVTVSFDPFNTTDPAIAVSMPLFVLIIQARLPVPSQAGFYGAAGRDKQRATL